MTITSARLQLIPLQPQALLALLESDERFHECFGLRAAPGYRDFFGSADVSPAWLEQLRSDAGHDVWKHGFAVVHQESQAVIGSIGFKGPPDKDGMVEIAYGIVPAFQGQGLATEAARAATAWAFQDERIRLIRAHTLPTNNASTRVLTKCGYVKLGEVVEPDDGLVWRWELPRLA